MDRARRPTLETPPGDAPDTAVPSEVRRGGGTPLGRPGNPFDRRSPFRLGFFTTFGVAIAVALIAAVVAVRDLLVLIFLAAFIAVGLNPVVDALCRRGMRRVLAVALVAVVGLALLAGFLSAVVPAIAAQVNHLVAAAPTYLANLQQKNATFARLDRHFHIVQHLSSSARDIEL